MPKYTVNKVNSLLPTSYHHTAVRLSGGGRDVFGDPATETSTAIPGCLIAPVVSRDEEADFASFTTDRATLYAPRTVIDEQGQQVTTTFDVTDRIRTPADSAIPGLWAVEAPPIAWPDGWQIPLRREGR